MKTPEGGSHMSPVRSFVRGVQGLGKGCRCSASRADIQKAGGRFLVTTLEVIQHPGVNIRVKIEEYWTEEIIFSSGVGDLPRYLSKWVSTAKFKSLG